MVKFTRDFSAWQSWTLPKVLLDKFEDMSNSGGSWGPDGYLYLSGHDPAELYRMRLPKGGLGAGAGRDHSDEHPRPGHRLGSL